MSLARWLHRVTGAETMLMAAGTVIVFCMVAGWIAVVIVGMVARISLCGVAVVAADGGAPVDAVARLYFVSYSFFTLGNGDYLPASGIWQIGTALLATTGLAVVTFSITYLVPLAGVVSGRRALASYISALGSTATSS